MLLGKLTVPADDVKYINLNMNLKAPWLQRCRQGMREGPDPHASSECGTVSLNYAYKDIKNC